MPAKQVCPSCSGSNLSVIYEVYDVPVHSVTLLRTRDQALNYPKGDIVLVFCQSCGFISNDAFDSTTQEYSSEYESTQSYSPAFNEFHRELAKRLINDYDLRGKEIIEIGCGQGEFLSLLCEMGNNHGIGFDPAYSPERINYQFPQNVRFIQDFYSERYNQHHGDFICCKMTLEHIRDTNQFMGTVRQSIGDSFRTLVFFQVPNARYVFNEVAFWDIYYEHCSYFSPGSIANLFRRTGFEVLDLWMDYEEQYLMITARPTENPYTAKLPQEEDFNTLLGEVIHFIEQYPLRRATWRKKIEKFNNEQKKVVLWGGGSKAVAFLTTLGIHLDEIKYVVDINPNKTGTFLAGTGQEIIPPGRLRDYQPDTIIVMNPYYCPEIERKLESLGLNPELVSVKIN